MVSHAKLLGHATFAPGGGGISAAQRMALRDKNSRPQAAVSGDKGYPRLLSGWPKKSSNFLFTTKMVQTQKV